MGFDYASDMKRQKLFNDKSLKAIRDALAPKETGAQTLKMPLGATKAFIIEALSKTLPELAVMAGDILNNPDRLKLSDKKGTMYCLPAGLDHNDEAIIHYDAQNTFQDVVILAHELGHALADDIGHEAGHDFFQNPPHMHEIQAYLLQILVLDALKEHSSPDIALNAKVFAQSPLLAMDAIIRSGDLAQDLLDALESKTPPNPQNLMQQHFGDDWNSQLSDQSNFHRARILSGVYELAEKTLQSIEDDIIDDDLTKKLTGQITKQYERPACFYAATLIVNLMNDLPPAASQDLLMSCLGRDGPKGLKNILQNHGITTPQDVMGHFAQENIGNLPTQKISATPKKTF